MNLSQITDAELQPGKKKDGPDASFIILDSSLDTSLELKDKDNLNTLYLDLCGDLVGRVYEKPPRWRLLYEKTGRKDLRFKSRSSDFPKLTLDRITDLDLKYTNESIQTGEVEAAIKQLKSNKAPGSDSDIAASALKNGGPAVVAKAREFCQAVFNGTAPPLQWTTNKIVPIPKKGSHSDMCNYRGISLMSTIAKLFNRVLINRIRPVIDKILRPNQAGFRPSRSTINQIHALRRILEAADDQQLSLIVTFVDFKKAFDSINRTFMFAVLRFYGIPAKVVDAIASL